MTTTQPAPAQQQVQQGATAVEAALASEVAVILAQAISADAIVGLLFKAFTRARVSIERAALHPAAVIVMKMPPDQLGFHGPATAMASRLNLMRRAQFLVSSAQRISTDIRQARSQNKRLRDVLPDIMTRESRYYGQHLNAIWSRMEAASRVDSASMEYGRLLGWNTVHDSHTTPECRAADRHNFWADRMPLIGFPGMTHPRCRCWPGRPYAGAAILPSRAGVLRRMIAA